MKNFLRGLFGYIGFASVTYGIYLIFVPAAFIIPGAFLFWLSTSGKTE